MSHLIVLCLTSVIASSLNDAIIRFEEVVMNWETECASEVDAFERFFAVSSITAANVLKSATTTSGLMPSGTYSTEQLDLKAKLLESIQSCRPTFNRLLTSLCDLKFSLEPYLQELKLDPREIADLDVHQNAIESAY